MGEVRSNYINPVVSFNAILCLNSFLSDPSTFRPQEQDKQKMTYACAASLMPYALLVPKYATL